MTFILFWGVGVKTFIIIYEKMQKILMQTFFINPMSIKLCGFSHLIDCTAAVKYDYTPFTRNYNLFVYQLTVEGQNKLRESKRIDSDFRGEMCLVYASDIFKYIWILTATN